MKKLIAEKPNKVKKKVTTKKVLDQSFPIVGIGASAGGLEALAQFFKHIPAENNMAFVVITHLDREHKSIMPELIKAHTPMSVLPIKNGLRLVPNTIYVIPPKKNALIKNGTLYLVAQDEPHYTNLPINFFFRSLAQSCGENAIAVILSGFGTDGSLGLRDIKQQGGIIVVQEPQTAKYDSMPKSAINTGLVDYVAPAEEIFEHFKKLLSKTHLVTNQISLEFGQIFSILRSKTGHDFSGYKISVLNRRIDRQMQRLHVSNMKDYVRYLRLNLQEVDHLFKELLISVTCFFRDPDAFDELKNIILPRLLKNKPKDYSFRVWVPGCATGEEVYSLAILLHEYMDENKRYFHVQIFGTDIDPIALETARASIYPATIAQEVSPERLSCFFIKEKNNYKVKKEIREMIIFGAQNIIQDPPFTKLDIISCRNLLIYLSAESQKKLFPLFHYSLKPKGILFLGMSESASHYEDLFTSISKKWKIFERKETSTASGFTFSNRQIRHDLLDSSFLSDKNIMINESFILIDTIKKFLIDRFVSPCVVVNKEGEIIFVHGNITDYILAEVQPIHANLLEIVYPGIKTTLMPALYRVVLHKTDMHYNNLSVRTSVGSFFMNLTVSLINNVAELNGLLLVNFEKVHRDKNTKNKSVDSAKKNKKLLDVEQELRFTKENLQATIEELETSNEEMQSTNEELQSINEELETSKEELQSVNEELVIVNTELQNRIEQIAAVNDDMNNLFNSTDIAAFFLDSSLRIKRFTPKAQELIHLIPADIGRSFRHFATNIKNTNLVENAEEVLRTLAHKTIKAQATNDQWYIVHILPYRTLKNMIDGVVITFTNITQNKLAEEKLSKLNDELHDQLTFSENILDTVREPLIVLSSEFKVISANRSFYNKFLLRADEIMGKFFYEIGESQWNFLSLRKLLDKVLSENLVFEGCEIEHNFSRVGHKKLLLNARKIIRHKTGNDMIILAIEEQ